MASPTRADHPAVNSPDRLDSWKAIAAYLGRSVPTVQRWEKNECMPVRRHAHEKQGSVYAFKSELDRWYHESGPPSAQSVFPLTRNIFNTFQKAFLVLGTHWRKVVTSTVVLSLLVAALAMWTSRAAKVRWARQQLLPQVEQLANTDSPYFASGDDSLFRAYQLAEIAEHYIGGDARLEKLRTAISHPVDITSDPAGADLYVSSYSGQENLYWGRSPLLQARVPRGFVRLRAERQGYKTAIVVLGQGSKLIHLALDRTESSPANMVRATGGKFGLALAHLGSQPSFQLDDYWIDKYEVSNREFKKFVDAGGYSDRKYWKYPFLKDGHPLSFSTATQLFVDRTGRPGPATWEAGDFPDGKGDYPVTGVSWYEAAAYGEFSGKSLPTIFHWVRAAGIFATAAISPLSNFANQGLARTGQYRAISAVGAYDMAGNAKEWCFNATGKGRFILGGAWNEPGYMFSEPDGQSPFARADNFGFRLVKYAVEVSPLLTRAVDYPRRDFNTEKPISDAEFKLIRGLYAYDKTPLRSKVEIVDDSGEEWRKEKVSFDAAYGGERIAAFLFLPRHVGPPYQTVLYFPGSSVIENASSADIEPELGSAVVKSGRAFVIPIYKSTYERKDALNTDYPAETVFYREHVLDWYKDLARTLDYLQTRSDLDSSRIAYYGFSWGARLGPLFLAVEPRLKTAVLVSGGLKFARTLPEADPFNFVSHVRVPVLMVNGKYDYFFPLETSQQPLLRLLGTSSQHKRHVVFDCGHAPPSAPLAKEVLPWLDRYLGEVKKRPEPSPQSR
ncbi:MAG TPA: SUMF1/EgtB/PvdO family nonheme iron enzyme [Terriglobales bacterium]|nr:SUMF1/EgtB/PvdO family nonheme iron enzyme [Terriglobales bacterium]